MGHTQPTRARIVLITGASGSGKTRMTKRLGLPLVTLDDFYRNGDDPFLPRRFGIVDWDDPLSWDADAAMAALIDLAEAGSAEIPIYSIPTNSRIGMTQVVTAGAPLIIAEGIFAAQLVDRIREAGLLADALCLRRHRLQTFWFRLLRDLAEARKPPHTLVRRGWGLMRQEPQMVNEWLALGCRAATPRQAERRIRHLAAMPAT